MRITGGAYCGRQIQCPKGIIRPSMDRMRESFFSVLGDIQGLSFLDLFSGSGIIGIEAVSRGAHKAVCVEKDPLKKKTLLANIALTEGKIKLYLFSAELFLQRCKEQFHLCFCDPPFDFRFKTEIIKMIDAKKILYPNGRLLIHFPEEEKIEHSIGNLKLTDSRKYGRSLLYFYTNTQQDLSGGQSFNNV